MISEWYIVRCKYLGNEDEDADRICRRPYSKNVGCPFKFISNCGNDSIDWVKFIIHRKDFILL